jgi:hypothetical protein
MVGFNIRVIPLRYPSSRKLGEGRVGRARVRRHRRDGRCGYRHVVLWRGDGGVRKREDAIGEGKEI